MREYTIIISPDAEADLNELEDYIALELQAPSTAVVYLREIRADIATLTEFPGRIRLVPNEPWHSRGVRRKNFKNFAVFFVIYEDDHTVYVMNVLYQKSDLPTILATRHLL